MTPETWTAIWLHDHGPALAQAICMWGWLLTGVVLPIAVVCSALYLRRVARAQERMQRVTEDFWGAERAGKKRSG